MARRWRFPTAVAAILALGGAATGRAEEPPETFETRIKAANEALAKRLGDLAEWCGGAKLLGERDAIAQDVLRLDPDDAKARTWLKFRRGPGGAWTRDEGWRPAKNVTNAAALPECLRRRRTIDREHAAFVLGALEDASPKPTLAEREKTLDLLGLVASSDEAVHAARDEVRDGDGWILAETFLARDRRAELRQAARSAAASAPEPRASSATAEDLAFVLGAVAALDAPPLRGVTAGSADELRQALRLATATAAWFRAAFGEASPGPGRIVFSVSESAEAGRRTIRARPEWSEREKAFAEPLNCTWVPGAPRVLVYADDAPVRLEWPVRQAVAQTLFRAFGVETTHGCLHEGFGVYLTSGITGTHLTWFVSPGAYAPAAGGAGTGEKLPLAQRLRAPTADWLEEARALCATRPPDLRLLLGKDVNAMTPEDLVASYALAAYLLEGRPQDAARFARLLTRDGLDAALATSVRATAEGLERRLLRWLDESVADPAPRPVPKPR